MKKVITYGTFDLFHQGHYNILKRAKELGDYLIVGVTTEFYDKNRGKLNVQNSLMERINNVKASGLADEIIVEEYEGQKIEDIQKYNVDIFAIGSDWKGKFDYLGEYCDIVYLPRTKGISSTQLRAEKSIIIKLGVVGYGRIAQRFIKESKFVSGVNIEGVFGRDIKRAEQFSKENELSFFTDSYDELLCNVDAVYIATPHLSHYEYIKKALNSNKHVICEKPLVLKKEEAIEVYNLAKAKKLVLLEAIKTAYSPGFLHLTSLAKSGAIGEIKSVEATFTKLVEGNIRELDFEQAGGSTTELATYPLIGIVKLLGTKPIESNSYSYYDKKRKVDLFSKLFLNYKNAIAIATTGLGVKSEGHMVISGTNGYIYVPAPWWKTEYFEVRYENSNDNRKYFYKFDGDGLRYELAEFVKMINSDQLETYKITSEESIFIIEIIEKFLSGKDDNIIE